MKKTKKLIYLFYLFALIFVIPELTLRVMGFHGESSKKSFIRYDQRFGWLLVPNTDSTDSEFEFSVKYHINNDGLREDSNIAIDKGNLYKILILGDSFTEGYGIRQDKRYSTTTESLLKKKHKRIEVVNAGVRGYNLTQYYLTFKALYQKYKPDLVIISITCGDLDVTSKSMPLFGIQVYFRPYFSFQNNQAVLKGIPVPLPDKSEYVNDKLEGLKKVLRHSTFYTFLRIASDNNHFLSRICILMRFKKNTPEPLTYNRSLSPDFVYDSMLNNKGENEKTSSFIITDMFNTLKRDNAELLIFILTNDSKDTNERFFMALNKSLGFLYANFPKLCSEYRRDRAKYHFKFDGHFNGAGNVLVAKTLAEFLERNTTFLDIDKNKSDDIISLEHSKRIKQ